MIQDSMSLVLNEMSERGTSVFGILNVSFVAQC